MACLLAVSSELATPPHPPPIFVRLLCYSYHPLIWLAPYYYGTPPPGTLLHGRTPRLRSVAVLHCLGGRCQRLGSDCNVLPCTLGLGCLAPPIFSFSQWFYLRTWKGFLLLYLGYWVAVVLLLPAFLFSYFAFFRFCTQDCGVSSGRDVRLVSYQRDLG